MAQTWLISGPPGCGKTTWMLNTLKNHQGSGATCALPGISTAGLEQADDGGIDQTYLQDQITDLIDLSNTDQAPNDQEQQLNLIELTQFDPPSSSALEGVDSSVIQQLEALGLRLDRALHFGETTTSQRRHLGVQPAGGLEHAPGEMRLGSQQPQQLLV